MPLTSSQNPLLQRVRRAVESGRPLDDGTIPAEGPHLLAEALRSPWKIEQILCTGESRQRQSGLLGDASRAGVEMTEVSARAFRAVSDTGQNQGILSLLRPQTFGWQNLFARGGSFVILDGVQDPGNAGAIVRSVEAFGGSGVVLTEGCVRISNGKFLRAASGSLFRLPYLEDVGRAEIVRECRSARCPIFALTSDGEKSIFGLSFVKQFALAVGSEGGGLSAEIRAESQALSIPTEGVESLNAAIACSIALFEAARQRASGTA